MRTSAWILAKPCRVLAIMGLMGFTVLGAPRAMSVGFPLQTITGAPATPPSSNPHDLAGMWAPAKGVLGTQGLPKDLRPGQSPSTTNWDQPLPLRAATEKLVDVLTTLSAQNTPIATPHLTCRPTGVAGITAPKFPVAIVQTSQEIFFLMEEDRDVYRVHLDRTHPAHIRPSYDGDSVGHWEGNTLVVDTTGYNGFGMLDENWHPVSAQAHLIERFTKSSDGRSLEIDETLDDPVYYSKPLRMHDRWVWSSGQRQLENDCSENPSDPAVSFFYLDPRFRPICTATWDDKSNTNKVTCRSTPNVAKLP